MLMKFKQLGIVKGMLSIVIVIGILVGAGYGLYYQFVYKQSPEYSLRVIYKAIQDGDTDTFLRWLMVKEFCIRCLIHILKNC